MSDTKILHEIKVWDNDAPTFSEFYDPETNTYYMNNWKSQGDQRSRVMQPGQYYSFKVRSKRVHCDDVAPLLNKVLKPGYTVVKF